MTRWSDVGASGTLALRAKVRTYSLEIRATLGRVLFLLNDRPRGDDRNPLVTAEATLHCLAANHFCTARAFLHALIQLPCLDSHLVQLQHESVGEGNKEKDRPVEPPGTESVSLLLSYRRREKSEQRTNHYNSDQPVAVLGAGNVQRASRAVAQLAVLTVATKGQRSSSSTNWNEPARMTLPFTTMSAGWVPGRGVRVACTAIDTVF